MDYLGCINNTQTFDELENILKEKNLIIKKYNSDNLALVKYNKNTCDLHDKDVQDCRGLIINTNNNKIICIPPTKSIKIKDFIEKVDNWDNIQIEDFIDGTMINVFHHNEKWCLSTRSCVGANCRWFSDKNFSQLFHESKNSLDFEKLNKLPKTWSFTFVLRHNDNRIVKEYQEPSIILVYARNITENKVDNLNLQYVKEKMSEVEIDIDIPNTYQFNNINELNEKVKSLNYQDQGYVLKYNGFRSKIRNPAYNYVKYLRGNTNNSKYLYFQLRQQKYLNEYLEYFPEKKDEFNQYTQELYSMTQNLFNLYQKFRVHKSITIDQIDHEYKPLIYNLHGMYLSSQNKITFQTVKNYVAKMDIPLLIYTINYKYRDNQTNKDE